jgi:hypothetical protein
VGTSGRWISENRVARTVCLEGKGTQRRQSVAQISLVLHPVEGRAVVAGFDGGRMTSDAGHCSWERPIGLVDRFASCFTDHRAVELVEHTVPLLVGQRAFGLALGYEDLIDHEALRHDPVLAVLGGKMADKRSDCALLAGKSTLNQLELSRTEHSRYHKI